MQWCVSNIWQPSRKLSTLAHLGSLSISTNTLEIIISIDVNILNLANQHFLGAASFRITDNSLVDTIIFVMYFEYSMENIIPKRTEQQFKANLLHTYFVVYAFSLVRIYSIPKLCFMYVPFAICLLLVIAFSHCLPQSNRIYNNSIGLQ